MTMFARMFGAGLIVAAAAASAAMLFTARPAQAQSCSYVQTDIAAGVGHYDCGGSGAGGAGQVHTAPGVPDCMVQQNAMRPCTSEQLRRAGVDPRMVGVWETPVGNGEWVLQIFADGSYKFHSEGSVFTPPNQGSFSSGNGEWTLTATSGYADNGHYAFLSANSWSAAGQHGGCVWRRRP